MEKNLYIARISEEIGVPASAINEELSKLAPSSKEDVVVKQNNKSAEVNPYERLTALRKLYGSSKIEEVSESLNNLSIGDDIFSAPSIEPENLERALVVVEGEYGNLSENDRDRVAVELVNKINQDFLSLNRIKYTKLLKDAERDNNEQEADRLSKILSEIMMRRHEPS